MTAREWQHSLLLPRPVDAERQADARSGRALGALSRSCTARTAAASIARLRIPIATARRADRRSRRQSAEQRHEHELEQLRAAARRDLPSQRQTVFRAGYGLTYNATPWARAVRGDNDYPITIAASFLNVDCRSASQHAVAGDPDDRAPDQSSGRVPLDLSAAEYTPEIDNVDRGYVQTWNIAFERRLMFDTSVDVAYVGAKGTDGYAALDINAPTVLGTGNQGRPYASLGRVVAINSWGDRLKTDYKSLQIALNKPFTHGVLFKGAYTLSKSMNESDNDGRATLNWNTPSEMFRNWAPAGFDRRHNFQLGFAYHSRGRAGQLRRGRERDHQRLAGQRRAGGVQRKPVHGDRKRHLVEHAEQPAGGGPVGDYNVLGNAAPTATGSTRAPSRSRPACASATRVATSSTALAARTSTSRCSARSGSAGSENSRSGWKRTTSSTGSSTPTRRTASRPARSAR